MAGSAARTSAVLIMFAIALVAGACRTGPHSDESDSEKWKSSSQHWSAARYRMLDSLTEDVGVVGKSRDEIRDLLGEGGKPRDTHWNYHISPDGMNFRYFTVVVEDDLVVGSHHLARLTA